MPFSQIHVTNALKKVEKIYAFYIHITDVWKKVGNFFQIDITSALKKMGEIREAYFKAHGFSIIM